MKYNVYTNNYDLYFKDIKTGDLFIKESELNNISAIWIKVMRSSALYRYDNTDYGINIETGELRPFSQMEKVRVYNKEINFYLNDFCK